jgi:hypothetical protein
LYGSESAPSVLGKRIRRNKGSGGMVIQEALSLTVPSQSRHPAWPGIPFVSHRAVSSHSGFTCGPPSAATTTATPCLPIPPARVTTSAGTQCRIHRSLYGSSQQTSANPRPLGECHDNHLLDGSHHVVPEFVSPADVFPTTVQKFGPCGDGFLTGVVSVAYFALQTCFHCSIASTSQPAHGQYKQEAAREVVLAMVPDRHIRSGSGPESNH